MSMYQPTQNTKPMKPKIELPIAISAIWIPSLDPDIRPTFLARIDEALIAKIPVGPTLSPSTIRQLSGAMLSLHPASVGCQTLLNRELFYNKVTGFALLVFWLPQTNDSPKYVARFKGSKTTIKPMNPRFAGQISPDYEKVPLNVATQAAPGEAKKKHGGRMNLRKARQSISHIFPGLIKIVYDQATGTVKSSFEGTTLQKVIKHRELYAHTLSKFGFPIISPDLDFKLGTWRVKTDGPKRKYYHVLTLYTAQDKWAKPSKLRVDFTPQWARKIQPKTDAEIDRELGDILTNRESLIKRLKIKTTK